MKTCKYCGRHVQSSHYCEMARRTIYYDSSDDFLLSAVIGAATGSALLGGLLGGDLAGGIVGDLLDGDLFD